MRLRDLIEVSESPDRATLEKRLISVAHRLEFGIVSAAMALETPTGGAPRFEMIGNTPAAFAEASRCSVGTARDPVMRRLKTLSVPFAYDERLYIDEGAADLFEEQAPYGYRTGISMALHMPGGRHFLLGVDREAELPDDELLTRLMADLQLVTVYAQEAAARVLLGEPVPSAPPEQQDRSAQPAGLRLTPREKEVLCWTREGKSAWAVGQILAMSENTVNFHLRNVMGKLGVSSKHVATMRATTLGLIG